MSESASWVKESPQTIKKKIIELARQNMSAEKIGLKLRDEHGIPNVKLLGIKIKDVLVEENLYKDSEIENAEKKIENLKSHFEKNHHDYTSQHAVFKKIGRLNKIKKNKR